MRQPALRSIDACATPGALRGGLGREPPASAKSTFCPPRAPLLAHFARGVIRLCLAARVAPPSAMSAHALAEAKKAMETERLSAAAHWGNVAAAKEALENGAERDNGTFDEARARACARAALLCAQSVLPLCNRLTADRRCRRTLPGRARRTEARRCTWRPRRASWSS